MAQIFRGRAQIEGVAGTFDVLTKKINQSISATQQYDEHIVQDANGNDAAWMSRNEKFEGDVQLWLVANDSSTRAQVATAAAFLSPFAIVTLSGFELAFLGTTGSPVTWQYISGATISLDSMSQGKMSVKLRRYADATQNALAATIPT